jgi:hypothetical protein
MNEALSLSLATARTADLDAKLSGFVPRSIVTLRQHPAGDWIAVWRTQNDLIACAGAAHPVDAIDALSARAAQMIAALGRGGDHA